VIAVGILQYDHRRGNGEQGEQVIPNKIIGGASNTFCSPSFFFTFFNILCDIAYIGNRSDRGKHGSEKWITIQVVRLTLSVIYLLL